MSTVNAPFGLKPVFHPSGNVVPVQATILSAYDSNIFLYSPVKYGATTWQGYVILAPTNETMIGTFMGCRYTDINGRPTFSNKWPANTVATAITCTITTDKLTVYEIQGTGSIAATAIGEQADISVNDTSAGNTITGLSNVTVGTFSASAAGALRCVGLSQAPNNDWGDTYTVVQVQISEHQNIADNGPY